MAVGDATTTTVARLTFLMSDGSSEQLDVPSPLDSLISSDTAVSVVTPAVESIAGGYANTANATIEALTKVEAVVTTRTSVSETVVQAGGEG